MLPLVRIEEVTNQLRSYLTTKSDHNDIRHSPIERVTREAKFQVSDGSRQVGCVLQAEDQT
jgi:hypothetical protein